MVDQLWSYLINGILEIEKGDNLYICFFPDADVPIRYKMSEARSIIEIIVGEDRDEKKAFIDYKEFVQGICYFSKEFYHEIIRIEPSMEHSYDSYLGYIDELEKKYGKYKNDI